MPGKKRVAKGGTRGPLLSGSSKPEASARKKWGGAGGGWVCDGCVGAENKLTRRRVGTDGGKKKNGWKS